MSCEAIKRRMEVIADGNINSVSSFTFKILCLIMLMAEVDIVNIKIKHYLYFQGGPSATARKIRFTDKERHL